MLLLRRRDLRGLERCWLLCFGWRRGERQLVTRGRSGKRVGEIGGRILGGRGGIGASLWRWRGRRGRSRLEDCVSGK